MNNTWILLKAQFKGVFNFQKLQGTSGKSSKTRSIMGVVIALSFVMLWAMLFGYYYMLTMASKSLGTPELTMGIAFAASSVFCLVTTVYKGAAILFSKGDYDILMPLPVKQSAVVASKLLLLYYINLVTTTFLALPAVIIHAITTNPDFLFYPFVLIGLLFLPVVPMLIGTILSVILSVLSSRFKHGNIVNILLMVVFLGGVLIFSFSADQMSEQAMTNMVKSLWDTVYSQYPPTRLFIAAVCDFNVFSLLLYAGGSAVIFWLSSLLVGTKYKAMYTALTTTRATAHYKMGDMAATSPLMALYKKELKRYLACPMYVVNTGVGALMLMGGAVAFAINSTEFLKMLEIDPAAGAFFGTLAPVVIAALIGMANTTGVSLSLEGVTLPLTKSLPVTASTLFLAKSMVNWTVTVPTVLIAGPLIAFTLKLDLLQGVLCVLLPLAYAVFSAFLGLVLNLHFPMLNWTNEVVVVKQSLSAMASMFGGMAIAAAMGFGLYAIPAQYTAYASFGMVALIVVAAFALWSYLKQTGSKLFYRL